jgi:hypothetical protein
MDDDKIKDIIRRASEIAKAAPESLQETAFNRAYEALTQTDTGENRAAKSATKKSASPSKGAEVPSTQKNTAYILENLDRTSIPEISSAPRVLERALYLLRGVNDMLNIDGLGAAEIATILTEKFRSRTTRQAVTQALDVAGTYVDRVQRGGKVIYRIMESGERFLNSGGEGTNATAKAGDKSKKRSRTKKGAAEKGSNESPPANQNESSTAQGEKKRKAGITPMTAMRQLRDEGFFDSSRRIGEIQEYLKHKKGYQMGLNVLSPALVRMVRADLLDRDRAEDGQYEYKRK